MSIRLVENVDSDCVTRGDQRRAALYELRLLLKDLVQLRREGTAHAKLAHAQGLVDGYMRSLTLLGVASDAELLQLVGDVRRGVDGPATAPVAETPTSFEVTQAIA